MANECKHLLVIAYDVRRFSAIVFTIFKSLQLHAGFAVIVAAKFWIEGGKAMPLGFSSDSKLEM